VPLNDVAVMTPVILTLPVPVIFLLFKSRLPPSCGVVSSTILERPLLPPEAVTVTIPPEIGDTERFDPKFIVAAVPTVDPPSKITTPEPDPTTPVRPDPSPTNDDAVTAPETLIPLDLNDIVL